jgi:hypothetical protein
MSQILWTNAASTTLATAISSVSTTISVASGAGALFPNPGSNQYFLATLSPATPGAQPSEIVLVSARSSDALTVTRAQEGTTAQAWGTGAIVQNLITAGTMNAMGQVINYAGNPNGYVAGAAGAGIIAPSIVWDSSNNLMWICTASGTTSTAQWNAQAPIVSPAFSGTPTAPTPTGSDNSTKLSTTAFVQTAIATRALLAGSSSQAFSVAAGASASQAVNLGQFSKSFANPGHQTFPGNLYLQWAVGPVDPADSSEPAYPVYWETPFPNVCAVAFVSMNLGSVTTAADFWYQTAGFNQSYVNIQRQRPNTGSFITTSQAFVFGIGW